MFSRGLWPNSCSYRSQHRTLSPAKRASCHSPRRSHLQGFLCCFFCSDNILHHYNFSLLFARTWVFPQIFEYAAVEVTWDKALQSIFALPIYMCFMSTIQNLLCSTPPVKRPKSIFLTWAPEERWGGRKNNLDITWRWFLKNQNTSARLTLAGTNNYQNSQALIPGNAVTWKKICKMWTSRKS